MKGTASMIPPVRMVSAWRERGSALIIILGSVVLLTGIILAFFSKALLQRQIAGSYSSGVLTEQAARVAAEYVVGRLRGEISDPSANDAVLDGGSLDNPPAFLPKSERMLPVREGTTLADHPTLLKLSTAGPSGIRTDAASANGRSFRASRWYATSRGGPGLEPDENARVPEWLYLTRGNGIRAIPVLADALDRTKDDFVIGRLAYAVYDVAGLLDANVAGYPAAAAGNASTKGSLAYADWSVIPGMGATSGQDMADWRNNATLSGFDAYVRGDWSSSGYLSVRHGDQIFINRRDMIRAADAGVAGLSSGALPYITHYTREWAVPSWSPVTPAGSSIDYAGLANNSTSTNRFLANVRFPASMPGNSTLTTYRSDGSSLARTIQPGEVLLRSRFSLRKLAWLGHNGPQNGGTPAAIKSCFGLEWDAANLQWIYTGATGNTVTGTIKRMEAVASERREPDFFELLKSVVLQGSTGFFPNSNDFQGLNSYSSTTNGPSALNHHTSSDVQILKIGINLLDQYDSDGFPSRLQTRDAANQNITLAGIEVLPSLYSLTQTPYRPNAGFRDVYKAWLEPVLWTVSETQTPPPASEQPGQIRIRFDAPVGGSVSSRLIALSGSGVNYVTAPSLNGSGRELRMTQPAASWSALGTAPLLMADAPGRGATVTTTRSDDQFTEASTTYIGFWLGDAFAPDSNLNPSASETISHYVFNLDSASASFVVEALYPNGNFYEIQRFRTGATGGLFGGSPSDRFTQLGRRVTVWIGTDPRTGRVGLTTVDVAGREPFNLATTLDFLRKSDAWGDGSRKIGSLSMRHSSLLNPNAPGNWNAPASGRYAHYRFADNSGGSNWDAPGVLDADMVKRPGDGYWTGDASGSNTLPQRQEARYRPVVLNRPFRSVGEMAYAFRDQPWKSLDFSTPLSADAGALDVFSVDDTSPLHPLRAGVLGLNTPYPEVLQAALSGTARTNTSHSTPVWTSAELDGVATSAKNSTSNGTLFLRHRSNLATQMVVAATASPSNMDDRIKERKESMVRALGDAGQTRTWNLLIDVVAQTGRLRTGSVSLQEFIVEGERRYWVHLALDRFTGEVVDSQIEPAPEQ